MTTRKKAARKKPKTVKAVTFSPAERAELKRFLQERERKRREANLEDFGDEDEDEDEDQDEENDDESEDNENDD